MNRKSRFNRSSSSSSGYDANVNTSPSAPTARQIPRPILKLLDFDRALTQRLFRMQRRIFRMQILKPYLIGVEYSCNIILWLSFWSLFAYIFNNRPQAVNLQFNMLFGLLIDVMIVGFLKAYFRRRRPATAPIAAGSSSVTAAASDQNPNKFSLPSGHCSRAIFVFYMLTVLFPVSYPLQLFVFAWTLMVCSSRLMLERHYILDVVSGCFTGFLLATIFPAIQLSESTTNFFYSMFAVSSVSDL